MMKRIMACLLAIVCLLTAFALADGVSMKVVNVNEAVNLRKGPSTDTESLAKVPLGTVVTDCVKVDGSEWISVNFNGTTGYIRSDKLQVVETAPAAETPAAEEPKAEEQPLQPVAAEEQQVAEGAPLQAEGTPLQPAGGEEAAPATKSVLADNAEAPVAAIGDASEYIDDFTILDEQVGKVRVIARQIYQEDHEYMMVVGLSKKGKELWKKETTTNHITELQQTEVFIAGTKKKPLVMIYNACFGLAAVDPATGDQVWELPRETVKLGGSISHAVNSKGVTYIGGYYGPDPVAIDIKGNVLWKADSGDAEATWLYRMELRDDGIACLYGSMAGENSGTIVYDFDGNVKEVIPD